MKRYSKLIPQGTRDLLFEECDDRRNVEAILSALFKEHKYRKVMTPTVEFYDVFAENDLGIEAEEMYKLSDSQKAEQPFFAPIIQRRLHVLLQPAFLKRIFL